MPFLVGHGCFPAAISDSHITRIARSDTPPEISVWKKIKTLFHPTNKPETLECIWKICHPPAGTTRKEVAGRFEQLKTLAYCGFKENVQSGRHGENHFCILNENSQEMLSVTLDEHGKYTVKCQGYHKTHSLSQDVEHAATAAPRTTKEYEAVWSAWERAAPPEEATDRAYVVQMLHQLHDDNSRHLNLSDLNISSLPDHLPPCIYYIKINRIPLTSLPTLPDGLTDMNIKNTPLISLPALPDGLTYMSIKNALLTSLPALPDGLTELVVSDTPLASLPMLPDGLPNLVVSHTLLTSLPVLPDGLMNLMVSNTPLTSLPALPDSLSHMDISETSLTELPESITGLSSNTYVDISNNPLSEHTRQALGAMTRAPDYSGPRIEFDIAGPSVPRETRPLNLAVADWLTPANGP